MVEDDRYARFRAVEGYEEAQDEISGSRVAIIGLGATGSTLAENMARRGAELVLVDRDYLEEKDVYTSSIYRPEHAESSLPKAKAAAQTLDSLTDLEFHVVELSSDNLGLLEDIDIVLDGTDNLDTRFLISEYCRREDIPWIYTAAVAETGFSAFFHEKCFNCVFEEVGAGDLETCETAGVMREVSSQAALMSALKASRYLAGKNVEEKLDTVSGSSFDIAHTGCEVCDGKNYPHLNASNKPSPVCGENSYRAGEDGSMERLAEVGDVIAENDYLVRAEYDGRHIVTYSSGRTVVEAEDREHASAIYTEIMGV